MPLALNRPTTPPVDLGFLPKPYLWPKRPTHRFLELYIKTHNKEPQKGRSFRLQVNPENPLI